MDEVVDEVSEDRGPSPSLHTTLAAPRTRYATDDPEEAERVVTELYLPNRLDLARDPAPLGMEVTAARIGALTAGRLTYGRPVRLRTADAHDFHVDLPLRGRAASTAGGTDPVGTRAGEGLVFSPGAPADIWWSADCVQLCLMVPRARLEAELEQLLGHSLRDPLVFDFAADLQSPIGRRWRTVLSLVLEELDHPTALGREPSVVRHLECLVLDGLLLGQAHNYSNRLGGERVVEPSTGIRRAVELIEELPAEPWTTARLAAAVHLSPRALQAGFSRELSVPPMTYLRQVRLRRARQALEEADARTTTVRAVAHGLGILHLGRFAAAYREAFGESPAQTLSPPRPASRDATTRQDPQRGRRATGS